MIGPSPLDAALKHVATNATRLDICRAEPITYEAAIGQSSLGHTTALSFMDPEDMPGGRRIVLRETRGLIEQRGRPGWWALSGNGSLLATGQIENASELVPGIEFELPPITIGLMG